MKTVSVETMKSLDAQTIEAGTSGETLMERAGQGVFCYLEEMLETYWEGFPVSGFSILAGKGNNGGDAYVVGRLLAEDGYDVTLYALCDPDDLKGEAAYNARIAREYVPVKVCEEPPDDAFLWGQIVVDGLLGTGVKGGLREPYDRIIAKLNASGCPVAAIDVPSGMDADTGGVTTNAVEADLTVTMGLPKQGLVTPEGLVRCGRLRCVDIGIHEAFIEKAEATGDALFAADMYKFRERRPRSSHKNTFGRVLAVCGSKNYTGAALLTATGALRAGGGLVRAAIPASIRPFYAAEPKALIFHNVPDGDKGYFSAESITPLLESQQEADVAILGPGIGTESETCQCVRELMQGHTALVVDADALNIVAQHPDWLPGGGNTILTPHPGELQRLLKGFGLENQLSQTRIEQATALATEANAIVILKGAGTVIASPTGRWTVNTSGNDALASAGTGDVLAGLVGGLWGQGFSAWEAATHGVFLHGLAAEESVLGARGFIADDLLEEIPTALKRLTPFP